MRDFTCPILSWLVSPVSCVRPCVHTSSAYSQPEECKPRFSRIKECRSPLVVYCWLCILNPVIPTTSSAAPGVVCLEPHWLKPARCLEIEMWAHAATKEPPGNVNSDGRQGGETEGRPIKWANSTKMVMGVSLQRWVGSWAYSICVLSFSNEFNCPFGRWQFQLSV